MPDAVGPRTSPADVPSNRSTELHRPAADGLIADVDAALGKHLLNIAQAHGETKVRPYRVADHLGRETMAFERDRLHGSVLGCGRKLPIAVTDACLPDNARGSGDGCSGRRMDQPAPQGRLVGNSFRAGCSSSVFGGSARSCPTFGDGRRPGRPASLIAAYRL